MINFLLRNIAGKKDQFGGKIKTKAFILYFLFLIFCQNEGCVNGLLGNWKMSLKRIENTQKGEGRETQMLKSSKRCWESKDNYVYLLINCLPPKEKGRC